MRRRSCTVNWKNMGDEELVAYFKKQYTHYSTRTQRWRNTPGQGANWVCRKYEACVPTTTAWYSVPVIGRCCDRYQDDLTESIHGSYFPVRTERKANRWCHNPLDALPSSVQTKMSLSFLLNQYLRSQNTRCYCVNATGPRFRPISLLQLPTINDTNMAAVPILTIWFLYYIVTCIPVFRQRVGKHIPATYAHATKEGHPLLGNDSVNTFPPTVRVQQDVNF
jgi:hypothetical protein